MHGVSEKIWVFYPSFNLTSARLIHLCDVNSRLLRLSLKFPLRLSSNVRVIVKNSNLKTTVKYRKLTKIPIYTASADAIDQERVGFPHRLNTWRRLKRLLHGDYKSKSQRNSSNSNARLIADPKAARETK